MGAHLDCAACGWTASAGGAVRQRWRAGHQGIPRALADFLDVEEPLKLRKSLIDFATTLRRRRLAQIGDRRLCTRHLLDLGKERLHLLFSRCDDPLASSVLAASDSLGGLSAETSSRISFLRSPEDAQHLHQLLHVCRLEALLHRVLGCVGLLGIRLGGAPGSHSRRADCRRRTLYTTAELSLADLPAHQTAHGAGL